MKGRVRLLFFWVGKDDVGGGWISIRQGENVVDHPWAEEVEVLFGSNPDRVPGGINRWGYGRERSYWDSKATDQLSQLDQTVFQGFMRQSKEKDLSEVQKKNESERAAGLYWYDGILSSVVDDQVLSEIRSFATTEDFDFRNAKPVFCGYEKRLESGPPDRVKRLGPEQRGIGPPLGFLTALRSSVRSALAAVQMGSQNSWKDLSLDYFHNGHPYQLTLSKVKLLDKLDLSLEDGAEKRFSQVVKAEYEVRKGGESGTHDFTLWFPTRGAHRGIPVRIVDKPRWWLQIELNLIPDSPAESARLKETLAELSNCQ